MKQINNETIFLLLKCTKDGEPTHSYNDNDIAKYFANVERQLSSYNDRIIFFRFPVRQ